MPKMLAPVVMTLAMTLSFSVFAAADKKAAQKSASVAKANPNEEPPIRKGTSITVLSVSPDKKKLIFQLNKELGVGPNVTTPELLINAVGIDSNRDTFMKNPSKLVGTVFILQKDLKLITPTLDDAQDKTK